MIFEQRPEARLSHVSSFGGEFHVKVTARAMP